MTQKPIRWGILGTANIARKNWHAIHNAGNSVLTAVASRTLARCQQFIADCQASVPLATPPQAYGSYEGLLSSTDVDAVYIPLPTGVRKEWVIRAAAAGKHVVCEKPCAVSLADLDEMLAACRRHRVQFMDGVMFVHGLRLQRVHQLLEQGDAIGDVRRVASQFSFRAGAEFLAANMRAHSSWEPHGCLGDLGWYSLAFTLEVLQGRMPRQVTGRVLSRFGHPASPQPVAAEFSGELLFENGVSSAFYCSFLTENQQWANVSGTRGHLHLADFVLPFSGDETAFEVNQPEFRVEGCHFIMETRPRRITVSESSNNHPSAQETNLFRNFADQIASGTLKQAWPERARRTQILLDACLESATQDSRPVTLPAHSSAR
ncbi:MAG TPA: Gfo/Idh/MocA family oxidoreductase [Verrucomicrobiota bacterium]|nr:oxidoreductase [Verrucomicrobiales bacterium]HRI16667.1 Gfo/Idh/MocA family oxidoreductase [Verrucomicrobiota bacterium]